MERFEITSNSAVLGLLFCLVLLQFPLLRLHEQVIHVVADGPLLLALLYVLSDQVRTKTSYFGSRVLIPKSFVSVGDDDEVNTRMLCSAYAIAKPDLKNSFSGSWSEFTQIPSAHVKITSHVSDFSVWIMLNSLVVCTLSRSVSVDSIATSSINLIMFVILLPVNNGQWAIACLATSGHS